MRKMVVLLLVFVLACMGIVATEIDNSLITLAKNQPKVANAAALYTIKQAPSKARQVRRKTQPHPVVTQVEVSHPQDEVQATIPASIRDSVIFQGSSTLREIALTFDDGPSPTYTQQILSILQSYGVRGTFFCIGRQVPALAATVRQVADAGEDVGNHTWNHPDLTYLSAASIRDQMSRTSAAILRATGRQPVLFRAPYGSLNNVVIDQASHLGMTTISWNVDTRDWQRPGVNSIVNRALATARNGSIIIMHDGGGNRSQTVLALPRIIEALQQRGFALVTITQLINDSHRGNV